MKHKGCTWEVLPLLVECKLIVQRHNALTMLLGYSRIVEVAGFIDDVKISWLTYMVIEQGWYASGLCFVCSALFCFVQDKRDDLDMTR